MTGMSFIYEVHFNTVLDSYPENVWKQKSNIKYTSLYLVLAEILETVCPLDNEADFFRSAPQTDSKILYGCDR